MDAAQESEKGLAVRRALDLIGALKVGVAICLDEIPADDFYAMLTIAEERSQVEKERLGRQGA